MPIPSSIRAYLDSEAVEYQIVSHTPAESPRHAAMLTGISPAVVARACVMKDWHGHLLVVIPADRHINLDAINKQLQRELTPVADYTIPVAFADCDPQSCPPLTGVFGLKALIDETLQQLDSVYFQAGSNTDLIRVSARGFRLLQAGAWTGEHISILDESMPATPPRPVAPRLERLAIKSRVQSIKHLPAMPEMSLRILQLRANPYAGAEDLARVVEHDPSLAAQIIRYAQAPLFGYRGKLESIQDAISRVLGYDMVMNIALGIAIGRSFTITHEGPLGLRAYWQEAVYCAALTQGLCKAVPRELRPKPGLAYLAGLLHDFGFLLFGHLFPDEFHLFNRQVADAPEIPVTEHEAALLDITHAEMGAWLMESWRLPVELIISAREHHNPDYVDTYAIYPHLVHIADCLIAGRTPPMQIMEECGLSQEQAMAVMATVVSGAEALDQMARQLAA